MKKILGILVLAFVIMGTVPFNAAAQQAAEPEKSCEKAKEPCVECQPGKPCGETQPATCEDDKIKRAATNVGLGWTEIPKGIVKVTKDTDNPFLGLTVGLLKGIGNAFARTASGAADTVTLPSKPGKDDQVVKDSMVSYGTNVTPGNTTDVK